MTPPSSSSTPIARHIPALDGLRGLAILAVLPHNAVWAYMGGNSPCLGVCPTPVKLGMLVFSTGWVGVQLFFVLSGFLITGNLLDSQRAPNYFRAFFGRRVLRIFPLYFATLALAYLILPALGVIAGPDAAARHDQIWFWVFLSNWATPFGASAWVFPHFWSLGVEEQFYFVWPFAVHRRTATALGRLCAAIIAVALTVRVALVLYGARPTLLYELTLARMDALAAGALIALLVRRMSRDALPVPAIFTRPLAVGVAVLAVVTLSTRGLAADHIVTQLVGQSLLAFAFGLLVFAAAEPRSNLEVRYGRWLSVAALRSVGKYSFAMYVLHVPIANGMSRFAPQFRSEFGENGVLPWIGAVLVLTYAAAFVSYHAYEKHFLRLKDRFVPLAAPAAA